MRRTTRHREDNTMQRSGHAERPADSEARVSAALAEPRFEPRRPGWGEPGPGSAPPYFSRRRNVTTIIQGLDPRPTWGAPSVGSGAGFRSATHVRDWLTNCCDCPRLTGSRHAKCAGQRRVVGRPIASRHRVALGGANYDHCDELVHRSTISTAPCPGTGIGVSWDCRSTTGAGPDRLARGVVAFPFLVADLDAVGGVFRSCRRDRLGNSTCHWALAARSAGHRARRRGAYPGVA
jgi:hypothetical protein